MTTTTARPMGDGKGSGASPASQPPLSHPFGAEPVPVSGKAGIANADAWEPATGYSDAFYQVGKLLGIPAQDKSPSEVWREQMWPMLAQRLASFEEMLEALGEAIPSLEAGLAAAKLVWEEGHADAGNPMRVSLLRDIDEAQAVLDNAHSAIARATGAA